MLWWTLRRLRAHNPEVRRRAAATLCKRRDVRTVEALLVALHDFSSEVRALVAQALGEIGDPRAVEPLVLALKRWSRWERWAAIEALVKIGGAAVEPLIAALTDQEPEVRKTADARAIEPLLATTTDANQAVRQAAAGVLGQIKDAGGVTPLLTALKTKDTTVGGHASETLAKLGYSAVAPLLTALKDQDRRVRTRAAEALTKIGSAAVEPLLAALQDTRRDIRQSAAEALAKVGDRRAVEPLVTMLWDVDSDVRQAAAESLAALGWHPMDAIERAREAAARRAWQEAASLGRAAVEPLRDALQDRRQDVRRGAAEALTTLGWPSAGPLQRLWLAIAFDRISEAVTLGGRAVEPLLAVLEHWDAEGRTKAAEILGQIGDVQAVQALIALTNDREVAETALHALEHILEANATGVDTEDLHHATALERVVQSRRQFSSSGGIVYIQGATESIDCAHVRQLARQELKRRGIEG